jgi:hypothetical protein
MRIWTEDFEGWSIEFERLIDAPDNRVVALVHQWATGKGSGVPVELHFGQVYEVEDGRVIRIRNYAASRGPRSGRALGVGALDEKRLFHDQNRFGANQADPKGFLAYLALVGRLSVSLSGTPSPSSL